MSKEKKVEMAVKVTLDSGSSKKVVIIRYPNNNDIENVLKIVGKELGNSDNLMLKQYKIKQRLLSKLLISINGNKDTNKPLSDMFNLQEQSKLSTVVEKLTGSGNEMTMEEEVVTL